MLGDISGLEKIYIVCGYRKYNSHRLCQRNVSDESVYVHFQCDFICNHWKKFGCKFQSIGASIPELAVQLF